MKSEAIPVKDWYKMGALQYSSSKTLAPLQDKTLSAKGAWQLRRSPLPQVRPLNYLYSTLYSSTSQHSLKSAFQRAFSACHFLVSCLHF